MARQYFVYITTDPERSQLYTGMTTNLSKRIEELEKSPENQNTFTGMNRCFYLIFKEEFSDLQEAVARQRSLKKMEKMQLERLISQQNPNWDVIKSQ